MSAWMRWAEMVVAGASAEMRVTRCAAAPQMRKHGSTRRSRTARRARVGNRRGERAKKPTSMPIRYQETPVLPTSQPQLLRSPRVGQEGRLWLFDRIALPHAPSGTPGESSDAVEIQLPPPP